MSDKLTKQRVLRIYALVFYVVWTLWELWAKSFVNNAVQNEYLSQFIKSGVIKNLVWTMPALLLIHRFKSDVYVGLKDMFTLRARALRYFFILLLLTVYLFVGAVLQKGRLSVSETFGLSDLIIVLFVGITEETVFRGWLLNSTVGEKKKWLPIIANSLMFLLIHFPVWIHEGVFITNFQNFSFLSPLLLGIIFGWTFIKSKNIWVPIVLHMYWDLLVFVFYS